MQKLGYLALAGALVGSAAAACDTAVAVVKTQPKVHLAKLISNLDYPASARAAGEQGLVEFVLQVGANGRVTGCTITRSSGSAALDSTTCRLMRARARFTPAVNDLGAPVADRTAGRIVWRL